MLGILQVFEKRNVHCVLESGNIILIKREKKILILRKALQSNLLERGRQRVTLFSNFSTAKGSWKSSSLARRVHVGSEAPP